MLWHCWLGVRKRMWPVKMEWQGVGVVICLKWGAVCSHIVQLMPLHPKTPSSLALFKSRLVLPFWYWFIQVVLEIRPLNGCSRSSSSSSHNANSGKAIRTSSWATTNLQSVSSTSLRSITNDGSGDDTLVCVSNSTRWCSDSVDCSFAGDKPARSVCLPPTFCN